MNEDWRRKAHCLGMDTNMFYPERGEAVKLRKAVCVGCPVRAQCLEAGMREHFGVWGGLSEQERRRMRRNKAFAELRGAAG